MGPPADGMARLRCAQQAARAAGLPLECTLVQLDSVTWLSESVAEARFRLVSERDAADALVLAEAELHLCAPSRTRLSAAS